MNSILGDFSANREKILDFTRRAFAEGCDLIVFPEHALFGYLPNDLLERETIVDDQLTELKKLEKEWPSGILGLVGCVTRVDGGARRKSSKMAEPLSSKRFFNSAALIEKKKKTRFFHKERLPAHDVFDEGRHLASGSLKDGKTTLRINSKKLAVQISICEDIWGWGDPKNPMAKLSRSGIDAVINLSASPFTKSKLKSRTAVIRETAMYFRAPLVYVNLVGAQDEVVFDGRSLVVDKNGKPVGGLAAFTEDLGFFEIKSKSVADVSSPKARRVRKSPPDGSIEILRRALVTGIRDFAYKTGLKRVHFGLSGGIDSAVVACLAVEALGAEAVTAVAMPGPFSSARSLILAKELSSNLSIRCLEMPINKSYDVLKESFEFASGEISFGLVHENLQARIRGLLLMALANKESSLLLATGNKSEYAAGYSTLYGDQCGGLAPLGDLLKNEVYKLAELYNKERKTIPAEIIDRAPSAELRADQKDSDSLPPYDELDAAVEKVIERRGPAKTETEKFVLQASLKSEFKRWQAPPILKISDHAFGRGRRMPIAHRAKS